MLYTFAFVKILCSDKMLVLAKNILMQYVGLLEVFLKLPKLAIMPMLVSEALLHENKNFSNKMLPPVNIDCL